MIRSCVAALISGSSSSIVPNSLIFCAIAYEAPEVRLTSVWLMPNDSSSLSKRNVSNMSASCGGVSLLAGVDASSWPAGVAEIGGDS